MEALSNIGVVLAKICLWAAGWIIGLGLCLVVTNVNLALGAEWSLVPFFGTRAYFNDNLVLTPLPHDPTYGYWISPGAEFAGKTERFELSGKAAMDFVDYYGGEPNRFTNIFLPLTMKYRTEKDEWGFTGGFTRDNTLMGELLTTGLVLRFTQRNLWDLNPSWTRMITEKLGFQSSFQFRDASYQDGLRLGLVDYQVFGGSAGLLYHLTERSEIQLMGTYTNFHTTNAPFGLRAGYPGIVLNMTHSFTERLKASAYGGPRFVSSNTEVGGLDIGTRDTIWTYGASLMQQFQEASVQLSVTREIIPSGFGLLIQTDRVGLLSSYNFSETLTASLDVAGYTVSGVTSLARGGTFQDQRLLYLMPKLSWHFAEWWKAELSYSYRWRDIDSFDSATSNAVMFMLTYFPPKLAVSN